MKKSFSIKNFAMVILCSLSLVLSSCACMTRGTTTCSEGNCKKTVSDGECPKVIEAVGMALLLGGMGYAMTQSKDDDKK